LFFRLLGGPFQFPGESAGIGWRQNKGGAELDAGRERADDLAGMEAA
jgi:hypothetical protein